MKVVIRRRAGLMLLVAVVSAVLSVAYLSVFADQSAPGSAAIAAVLAAIAVVHGLAWRGSRTPLLVADETGVRTRLGADWVGLPWSGVARVEVEPRGRLTDGRVTVVPQHTENALSSLTARGRFAATVGRFLYDAPLAVAYGWNTHEEGLDLLTDLERVAAGRAPIVVGGQSTAAPSPTVELTATTTDEPSGPVVDPPTTAGEVEPPRPIAAVVSALRSATTARRTEVTMPARPDPVVMGSLALSDSADDAATDPLPELTELRRTKDTAVSNVSLIIDSTTPLSARAMATVRRPQPISVGFDTAETPAVVDERLHVSLLGGEIAEARARLALTVDELAERTRIRPHVIECIEVDDFSPCGGDFYARGHLRMLARVLGIEAGPLLRTYDEEFATEPTNPRDVFVADLATGNYGIVRGTGAGPNWMALLGAVLVLMLVWGVARYVTAAADVGPDTSPNVTHNARGLGSPGPGNTPIPTAKKVGVTMTATGDSRVVVTDGDGDVLFRGRLHDGDVKGVRGKAPLDVMAKDGGAVALKVRGQEFGPVGAPGERASYIVEAKR